MMEGSRYCGNFPSLAKGGISIHSSDQDETKCPIHREDITRVTNPHPHATMPCLASPLPSVEDSQTAPSTLHRTSTTLRSAQTKQEPLCARPCETSPLPIFQATTSTLPNLNRNEHKPPRQSIAHQKQDLLGFSLRLCMKNSRRNASFPNFLVRSARGEHAGWINAESRKIQSPGYLVLYSSIYGNRLLNRLGS